MKRRMKIGLGLAFLIAALLTLMAVLVGPRFLSFKLKSPSPLPAGSWLVAGPFSGNVDNGLYKDYLSGPGEEQTRAREGEQARWGLTGVVRWQTTSPSDQGLIDLAKIWPAASYESIAYAYTEIESEGDQYAVATIGSGADVQLRVNDEIVYESRVFRKAELNKDTVVLPLRKGINPVLVKAQRGLNWRFQWAVTVPSGALFVNKQETIVPDFRVGEPVAAWGQVEVTNTGGIRLPDVTVEVLEDDVLSPSRSEIASLEPDEVRRIPIWIATKTSDAAGAGRVIQIRVFTGQDEYRLEVKPRVRDPKTSFVTTYRSTLDGSVQPYSVLLPPTFDERTTYALILLLHGSQVTLWGGNIIAYSPKEWAVQVAVHDRGNNDYRGVGEVDIDEVLAEVSKRYRIDPDRMYLSGHSMGGYGTWFLATRYPDRWAAISPQTARTDLSLEHSTMRITGNGVQQAFQTRLLQSWSPILFADNLLHLPAYIMHGALDASVSHSRTMSARLDALGYEHIYDENPDAGHWWGTRPAHQGTLCVDNSEITDFFLKHNRRAVNPKLVVYKTDNLRYRRAYWVAIDELDDANKIASVRAEVVSPDDIAVQLENITQLTLELNEHLIAIDRPLTVTVNGNVAFRGTLNGTPRLILRRESDGSLAGSTAGSFARLDEKADPRVGTPIRPLARYESSRDLRLAAGRAEYTPPNEQPIAAQPIAKTESLYGPVIDAFNKPFILVVGSNGAGEEANRMNQASRRAAQAVARDWMTRCNGVARIKTDLEVTPDDIDSSNLILFGNAATNSLIGAVNGELPIRFGPTGIILAEREISGDDTGIVMIRPNPLNQSKYVVIVGGTTAGSMLTASRLRLTELPDYAVFDRRALEGKRVALLDGGFFDKHWRRPN
jgi:pimeloyl-ACP methyl ester carboxylesterase